MPQYFHESQLLFLQHITGIIKGDIQTGYFRDNEKNAQIHVHTLRRFII